MTLTDLLIIYLAFGAPLAVYKYLQKRTIATRRRVLISITTFFFWVPAAIEIGYLHIANAYFRVGFVSDRDPDSMQHQLAAAREAITTELIQLSAGESLHDTRAAVDRYAGLADSVRQIRAEKSGSPALFQAAGRTKYDLGEICLMRRNLRRLERHHTQARQDFLTLLERATARSASPGVVGRAIDLARQLEDRETVLKLTALKTTKGEVWNSVQQVEPQMITTVPPIAMTASLRND